MVNFLCTVHLSNFISIFFVNIDPLCNIIIHFIFMSIIFNNGMQLYVLNLNLISHFSFVFSAVIMSHQEPISMRDPKFVSVAAKVLPLHKHYLHSGPTSVPTFLRKNKSEIKQKESKLSRRGKEIPFKPVKAMPTSKTKKHFGSTAQTQVFRNQVKKPKKFSKPKRRGRGRLTSSDLWRLNRLSHKFTKTMGRKGRERNNKVSKNLFNRL
jgi:hypothetical protein